MIDLHQLPVWPQSRDSLAAQMADDLIAEWEKEWRLQGDERFYPLHTFLVAKAAQWGADQELDACCDWLDDNCCVDPQDNAIEPIELRAARRPKPLSLKQQALQALENGFTRPSANDTEEFLTLPIKDEVVIRRALEALPDE